MISSNDLENWIDQILLENDELFSLIDADSLKEFSGSLADFIRLLCDQLKIPPKQIFEII